MTDVSPVEQDLDHAQSREAPTADGADLRYPQIFLQASFASLLSSSFPSTSESQDTMPTSEHSLSESWASLSEADYTPDDDIRSEATGVVSLLGTNTSEDSQSEAGHQDTHEPEEAHEQEHGVVESAELPTPVQASVAQLPEFQPYDSTSIIGAPSPNAIKFDEDQSWPMTGRVDLMHSIKVFDEKEKADLARYIPKVHRAAQLNGTIRMTTSRGSIRRDRPFRLLYSGSPLAVETRAEILKKVGDVLVANSDVSIRHSMAASRYHVIPSEFGGPGSSPNYAELIPLQFQQMIVDECLAVEATPSKQDSAHSQIQLTYKGGQSILSVWDCAAYQVPQGSTWDPPDLAIIFVRESDGTQRQLFSGRLNEFTSRHHIPTLVIRDDNDWSTSYDYIVPDRRSLHMCVESRATGILQLLPIDLSSFINLDAGQLNKHIACLCAIYDQDAERQKIALKLRQAQELQETPGDVEKNLSKSIVAQNRTKAFLVKHEDTINKTWQVSVGMVLLILGFSFCKELLIFLAAYFGGTASMASIAPFTTAQSIQPVVSMITTNAMLPAAIASVSTTSLQIKPFAVGLTAPNMDKELARLALDAAAVYNKSDKFQIQILGDGHLVVKAPQMLLGKKKTPQVTISVTRRSVEVPSNTSKLFDGLYTVKIDREHANGLLNVTISVKKPSITEIYELEFGQPWMPADKLRDAFRQLWQPFQKQLNLLESNPGVMLDNARAIAQENLRSASTFGMALVSNVTDHYGPSIRKLSNTAQSKSQHLYTDAVQRVTAMAQAVGRETHTELQQFGTMSHVAGQRATVLAHKLFADMSAGMTYLRDHAASIDLENMRDNFVRSETLAEAQERARKMASDFSNKVQARVEKVKAWKAERRTTRAEKKFRKREGKKGVGKKAWHENVRVNFRF